MTSSPPASLAPSTDGPVRIPAEELLPWAVFTGLISLLLIYFLGTEQGAAALFSGGYVHEFVHDARHLLGFPCH
ncbi:MAG: CbtB-domain containing protein [Methylorubrum populi]